MSPDVVHLRIADGLAVEFEVVDSGTDGVVVVDDDGLQWRVTAEEVPA
jgi:hypothetical protein